MVVEVERQLCIKITSIGYFETFPIESILGGRQLCIKKKKKLPAEIVLGITHSLNMYANFFPG